MQNENLPFVRVASAVHRVAIGHPIENVERMTELIHTESMMQGAQLVVFPELCLTGYSCGELFKQQLLLDAVESALSVFAHILSDWYNEYGLDQYYIVGLPVRVRGLLFNVAAVVHASGKILAMVPKSLLPNTNEFYEARWFARASQLPEDVKTISFAGQDDIPIGTDLIIEAEGERPFTFGVEVCEDLWGAVSPSQFLVLGGAEILVNPSASTRVVGKKQFRRELVASQSMRCTAAYVYSSCGPGESTTDVVWSGHLLIAERGRVLKDKMCSKKAGMIVQDVDVEALRHDRQDNSAFRQLVEQYQPRFRRVVHDGSVSSYGYAGEMDEVHALRDAIRPVCRHIDPHPFVPEDPATRDELCADIVDMLTSALMERLRSIRGGKPVATTIGVSGGSDSTLALLIAVLTYDELGWDRTLIHAYTMPGPGTTSRTKGNADILMEILGVTMRVAPIEAMAAEALRRVGHEPCWTCVQCENAQARARTMVLMTTGFPVLGTGDLTEIALGWCTYNADHMSMYNVNADVPKTLVKHLIYWLSQQDVFMRIEGCLADVLETPVSPELVKTDDDAIHQKSEDILGPYELHDFIFSWFARFGKSPAVIAHLAMEAFAGVYDWNTILDTILIFYKRFGRGSQFKRDAVPGGPKIGTVSLSPRGDWRMPSEADFTIWIQEIEEMPRYDED